MEKFKLPPSSGSAALKQLNPIHKKGHEIFLKIKEILAQNYKCPTNFKILTWYWFNNLQ